MNWHKQTNYNNQAKILNIIKDNEGLSFMEILEKSKMGAATVSKYMKRLVNNKEVVATKKVNFKKRAFRITLKGSMKLEKSIEDAKNSLFDSLLLLVEDKDDAPAGLEQMLQQYLESRGMN